MATRKPRMSNTSVQLATGKTWPQWFKILDKFPKGKTHTERAAWLYKHHLKKAWWTQMVTVTYEQARGLRAKHQTTTGFQISKSVTVSIPIATLYAWWTTKRNRWLSLKGLRITSATKLKYLHWSWPGGSRVDIGFYTRGKSKSSVQLQHSKLKNAAAAKKMKVWWEVQLKKFMKQADHA